MALPKFIIYQKLIPSRCRNQGAVDETLTILLSLLFSRIFPFHSVQQKICQKKMTCKYQKGQQQKNWYCSVALLIVREKFSNHTQSFITFGIIPLDFKKCQFNVSIF
jgi:hypothetical protein